MHRGTCVLLATAIPRNAWDPLRHNTKWHDSYAKRIAMRRYWPIKKWSIGLEPANPRDWLNSMSSLRNVVYAYNAALRACGSFPEMVPLYQEMKQRGVLIDVDTMHVMIARAARYEKVHIPDVFRLFQEMRDLRARPDVSIAEMLHTVWNHSQGCDAAWREAARCMLIDLYNSLCSEVLRISESYQDLRCAQFHRIRENLSELGGTLNPELWKRFISSLTSADMIISEFASFLLDFVPDHHTEADVAVLQVSVPIVHHHLNRDSNSADAFAEDDAINGVFLAALHRIVDFPVSGAMSRTETQRGQLLALIMVFTRAGLLVSPDIAAQAMEIAKYVEDRKLRDEDAILCIRNCARVSSPSVNLQACNAWLRRQPVIDGRVVGRYLAARDPWSPSSFSFEQNGRVHPFEIKSTTADSRQTPSSSTTTELVPTTEAEQQAAAAAQPLRTSDDITVRWKDAQKLIASTGVLNPNDRHKKSSDGEHINIEVFTGLAVFLRRMIGLDERCAFDAYAKAFDLLKVLKRDLDIYCSSTSSSSSDPIEPEFECWESLLVALRTMMDYLAGRYQPKTKNEQNRADTLFKEIAAYRSQLLVETKDRFGGRFAILWLQEV